MDPIKATLLANVYDVAIETPLELASKSSKRLGCKVLLKREDLQPVHSFKIRGAYNKMSSLKNEERARGVIAASAGNHAQGVAMSAQKLGISATIVMPNTTPSIKVEAVKSFGAKTILFGDNYSEAFDHAMEIIDKTGQTFVHPFNDPLVIAGQGTIARELLEQNPHITHIFCAVGGGGLLAGIAQYIKAIRPDIKLIGVEPEDSNAMQASVKAGKLVELKDVGIFADGVAVKKVGKLTFDICKKFVDDFITVNNDQICSAIKSIFEETRNIVEPAGALSLAGIEHYDLPKNAVAVAICSGANMTFERLQYVAERTMLGSNKEVLYAVEIPEKAGSALQFCQKVVNGHSITEFNYRLNSRDTANIFVGLGISGLEEKQKFESKMKNCDYKFFDLSNDDVAKEHIRHMIGGQAEQATNEHFYSINFPERPGALGSFLQKITAKELNISLFHYRGQGGDIGRVLIGLEAANKQQLEKTLKETGYSYTDVSDVTSVRLFT